MIFCHTRKTASWLVDKMRADGHSVALLSGELSVEERIQVLDRFRDGLEKILITTNVLSRGIDIEQVFLYFLRKKTFKFVRPCKVWHLRHNLNL